MSLPSRLQEKKIFNSEFFTLETLFCIKWEMIDKYEVRMALTSLSLIPPSEDNEVT